MAAGLGKQALLGLVFWAGSALAAPVLAPPAPPGDTVKRFIKVPSGQIALTHARVIDGTGAPLLEDRTVLIDGAKIAAVQLAITSVHSRMEPSCEPHVAASR